MIEEIINKAKTEDKKVYIYTHKYPDGDAISSACALSQYLSNNVIDATCVFANPIFSYAPITGKIPTTRSIEPNYISIIVDTSTVDYAENQLFLSSTPEDTYVIDHHLKNSNQASIEDELHIPQKNVIRDSSAISTTELLLNEFDNEKITLKIANLLTLGIITDSAKLKFLKENTLNNLSKLLELGVNYEQILTICTPKIKIREVAGISKLLLHTQKFNIGNTFGAILELDNKTVNDFSTQYGLRNIQKKIFKMSDITDCSFTCIASENSPNEFDLEFRSSSIYENFNVQELAAKYNGGGHYNASGCHITHKGNQTIRSLIESDVLTTFGNSTTNLTEFISSNETKKLLELLNKTNNLTKDVTPDLLKEISMLQNQGANYDFAFRKFKTFTKFMLENEILSRIPYSSLIQKNPIVSIYLSAKEVSEICEKYNVSEEDILKTIEIFSNIDIKLASISFNGKKVQIDKNGKITSGNSYQKTQALTR